MWEATGKAIYQARRARSMSQELAAQRAGVSVRTWSRLENGQAMGTDTLALVSGVVGVTASQLRSLGQSEAAELLEARQKVRLTGEMPTVTDQTNPEFSALMEAQETLLRAGWSVTMLAGEAGEYVMTIRKP